MKKIFAAIILISTLALCGCENSADEPQPDGTETLATTQYDL